MAKAKPLHLILDDLEALYRRPDPHIEDPFEQILWENVAYLVSDEKRALAFAALRKRVGLTPERILAAPPKALWEVATLGGMLPEMRVAKLLAIAEMTRARFDGDLRPVLKRPLGEAKKALRLFPGIGEPGAEKILLFAGALPVLALESNGLRVLLRLGYGEEKKSYRATYRAAQAAVDPELKKDSAWLIRAHQLLRRHGQERCRRTRPRCPACPLADRCAFYKGSRA